MELVSKEGDDAPGDSHTRPIIPSDPPEEVIHVTDEDFTVRAVAVGLFIGLLLCCANMYFGLQTGWVTMGSVQAALLGFGIFKALPARYRLSSFGPKENCLLQSTAVAAATMPLAAGFVGVIPALQLLRGAEGESPFGWWDLFFWSLAVAFFGVFFAVPLRKQTILREKLRFPSGTATAQLIATLHQRPTLVTTEPHEPAVESEAMLGLGSGTVTDSQLRLVWRYLLLSFLLSSLYTLLAFLFPVLAQIPVFSLLQLPALTQWYWTLTPSLSYVGQGMIMGTRSGLSLLAGALVGWAILGPMARYAGWAPGPIGDWKTGAKGWILWVSLSVMLAESLASVLLLAVKTAMAYRATRSRTSDVTDPAPPSQQVPLVAWTLGLGLSSVLCTLLVSVAFQVAPYQPLVAVLLALGVSVLAVRALGETDLNPVSGVGKISQLVFAFVAPGNMVSNVLAGGIAEAGAQQCGDMMQDLKTGHLLGASPRAQFYGQLIGSAFSILFTLTAYKLYTAAYQIPSTTFPVPMADIWIAMAELANGGAWPLNVWPFCLLFGLAAASLPLIGYFLPRLEPWLPSGVAFAMGIYVTPNWTLPRVAGAVASWAWAQRSPRSHEQYAIAVASGFVLGEGVTSIVCALASALTLNCQRFGYGSLFVLLRSLLTPLSTCYG